jgi:hypothetical protein
LREKKYTLEMNVDNVVELLLGRISNRRIKAISGIVDQKVELFRPKMIPQHRLQLVKKTFEAAGVSRIQLQCRRLPVPPLNFGNYGEGLFLFTIIGEDNINALFGQVQRHILA